MIVRMAQIAVMGPRELLLDVLASIERLGILQIDQKSKPEQLKEIETALRSVVLDTESLGQRFLYENLLQKIDALLAHLPPGAGREYYLDNAGIAQFLAEVVDKHLENLRGLEQEQKQLSQAQNALAASRLFLEAISPLFTEKNEKPILDYIGISIRDPMALAELQRHLQQEIGKPVTIDTIEGAQGELLGVITAEQDVAELIRKKLSRDLIAEHQLPKELAGLSVPEKIAALASKHAELQERQRQITMQLATFAQRWQGVYAHVHGWLVVQLSLLNATASVYQTEMCFFIFGWIPQEEVVRFRQKLTAEFDGKVTVEEKEILTRDLDRVPTALHNPAYFKPFEIFSRLLPVPGYSSFDLTPYIGIFFPLFFGMMLGDLGYGAIVSCLGLLLLFRWRKKVIVQEHPIFGRSARLTYTTGYAAPACLPEPGTLLNDYNQINPQVIGPGERLRRKKKLVSDAGKIMVVCGVYAMIFGLLYGEFLGTAGSALLGLKPLLLDRHETILPMFYFALGAGVIHISLALLLGGLSARRKGEPREALFKFVSILFIFFVSLLAATYIFPLSSLLQKPLLAGLGIIALLLLLTGGLMAPLEALKHLGNIISYARIMAIGLTSVLLAYVANHLAGMTGSIWLGVLIGILLHGFNVLLGIFAPTIHALRLHYVEFFSKTTEKGGREFVPLGKKKNRA